MIDFKRNFRDYNTVNLRIFQNLERIPSDVDLIVAVPRSGMIFGTIISEFTRIPVCTIYEYISGVSQCTFSDHSKASKYDGSNAHHILLVDDTCSSGQSLLNAKSMILEKTADVKITIFAYFVENKGKEIADIYIEDGNWHSFNFSILKYCSPAAAFDMDGVLCSEVPPAFDDDGERYISYLKNQKPRFIPDASIGAIITGRLEKYRSVTEEWLKEHNISYSHLIMHPARNNIERANMGSSPFKAMVYGRSNLSLFVESNFQEAIDIKNRTNKQVFCTDTMTML